MRRILIALVFTLGWSAAPLPGAPGTDLLATLRPGHPRLIMTDEALAAAKAAAVADPLRAALHRSIVATAGAILRAPPIRHPDTGGSQEQQRYAVYDILTCAMAYRLSGDQRFLARAKSDLLTVAAMPDWDPADDLAVGELSLAEAVGYDWLYPQLDAPTRATVKAALIRNALDFADASYRRHARWTLGDGNHNQACNSGMVSAALALADEQPALARRVLAGARQSMVLALAAYAPDGSFPEGPGYWSYGTTCSVITFAELQSALGTDLGLSAVPGFSRTVQYYEAVQGPRGAVFNYADSTDDLQNTPARAWLAERYHVPAAARDTRRLLGITLRRERVVPFDRTIQSQVINRFFALHAAWFPDAPSREASAPVDELPLDLHFRGTADLAVFRSAWNDPRAILVGFKAGENGDHHGHMDLGSFVLDADGERWAMDLGPDSANGSYDLPGYFDIGSRRWTYFRTNNHSHNTVTPGDGLQARHVAAPIVAFGSSPQFAFAVADLTAIYPSVAASLRRGVALIDRSRVLIQDEYQPARQDVPLHWVMVTGQRIELAPDGRSAVLAAHGHSLRADILQPANGRFHLGSTRPRTSRENQNEGTAILGIDLAMDSASGPARLAVLFTPQKPASAPQGPPPLRPLADWR